MPDRVKSLEKVDSIKDDQRPWLEFVKPIQNELKKIWDLIKSRPTRAETGMAEKMELDSKKKKRRDKMMCSNCFERQVIKDKSQASR